MGKKIHLKEYETDSLAEDLNAFLTEWLKKWKEKRFAKERPLTR